MSLHREVRFEDDVCGHLAALGWLYDAAAGPRHDRARALFSEDLAAWIQESQPDAWAALTKTHGPAAVEVLSRQALNSERLREELLKILLGPGDLYGALRRRAGASDADA